MEIFWEHRALSNHEAVIILEFLIKVQIAVLSENSVLRDRGQLRPWANPPGSRCSFPTQLHMSDEMHTLPCQERTDGNLWQSTQHEQGGNSRFSYTAFEKLPDFLPETL